MRNLVKAFKALSDDTRLRIFGLLLERECCVCEVMQALGISQTRASRNLNVLHNAGLLNVRKSGQWTVFSLDRESLGLLPKELIDAVSSGLAGDPEILADRERLRRSRRVGPGCDRRTSRSTKEKEDARNTEDGHSSR